MVGGLAVPRFKLCYSPTSVKNLLLARVERVALRADIRMDLAALRSAVRRERAATGARHRGLDVRGVNIGFHRVSLIGCRVDSRGEPWTGT